MGNNRHAPLVRCSRHLWSSLPNAVSYQKQNQDCTSAAADANTRCDHCSDLRSICMIFIFSGTERICVSTCHRCGVMMGNNRRAPVVCGSCWAHCTTLSYKREIVVAARAPRPTRAPDVITNLTYTTLLQPIVAPCVLNFTKRSYTSTPSYPLGQLDPNSCCILLQINQRILFFLAASLHLNLSLISLSGLSWILNFLLLVVNWWSVRGYLLIGSEEGCSRMVRSCTVVLYLSSCSRSDAHAHLPMRPCRASATSPARFLWCQSVRSLWLAEMCLCSVGRTHGDGSAPGGQRRG